MSVLEWCTIDMPPLITSKSRQATFGAEISFGQLVRPRPRLIIGLYYLGLCNFSEANWDPQSSAYPCI